MKSIYLILLTAIIFSGCKNDGKESFAFGNFESEEIIVSAEVSGIIREFNVVEGMDITVDSLLGFIDTTQLWLKKKQYETGVKTIKGKIEQLDMQMKVNEVGMKNLVREKERIEALLNDGAATSKQLDDLNGQINLLDAQMGVIQSQIVSAQTEIESVRIQIDQVNDQLARSYIRSPISGVVLEKYIFAGELAVTGKPVFKISNLDKLILRVFIDGDQLEMLKLGMKVRVLVDIENGQQKEYPGTVMWVSSKAEFTPKIIQTRKERINLVYAVKILVPNDGGLKIGMPAEITII